MGGEQSPWPDYSLRGRNRQGIRTPGMGWNSLPVLGLEGSTSIYTRDGEAGLKKIRNMIRLVCVGGPI